MLARCKNFYLTSILLICDLYNLRFTQFSMCTLTISIYHELLKVTRFDIVTKANDSINLNIVKSFIFFLSKNDLFLIRIFKIVLDGCFVDNLIPYCTILRYCAPLDN